MATNAALKIIDESPALGLDVPEGQSFEQWTEMGRSLASASKVLNWWIGDWWAAGSHRYGERAAVAAQGIFGREFGSLANLASVCRAFQTSRRREHLSFTHHAEVAGLPPAKADALLDKAERENLSTRDIRSAAQTTKATDRRPSVPDDYLIQKKTPEIATEIADEAARLGRKLPDFLAFLLALGWQQYRSTLDA